MEPKDGDNVGVFGRIRGGEAAAVPSNESCSGGGGYFSTSSSADVSVM